MKARVALGAPVKGRVAPGAREAATRERLLEAAVELFADRGFRRVTVRDICTQARANVAAVNYHFGDKQRLYREILDRAVASVKEFDEAARNVSRRASPAEKLRHYVQSYLVLAEDATVARRAKLIRELFRRELSEPTGMRERFVDEVLGPRWRYLGEIVKEELGRSATPAIVSECVLSIQAQCLMPVAAPALGPVRLGTRAERERFVEHVVSFSLAGVRARAAAARGGRLRGKRAPK